MLYKSEYYYYYYYITKKIGKKTNKNWAVVQLSFRCVTNLTIRHRCSSIRGVAAFTSITDAGLHNLSATALALGLPTSQHRMLCFTVFQTCYHELSPVHYSFSHFLNPFSATSSHIICSLLQTYFVRLLQCTGKRLQKNCKEINW